MHFASRQAVRILGDLGKVVLVLVFHLVFSGVILFLERVSLSDCLWQTRYRMLHQERRGLFQHAKVCSGLLTVKTDGLGMVI